MGLDMYLYARDYISGYEFSPAEERADALAVMTVAQRRGFPTPISPSVEIQVEVAYWRKANQIHNWFVKNVQNGVDECQYSYVSRSQLKELHDLCVDLLKDRNPDKAAKLLPTQCGFFFGSTEYDEFYWHNIENTISQLEPLLENDNVEYYYCSSW